MDLTQYTAGDALSVAGAFITSGSHVVLLPEGGGRFVNRILAEHVAEYGARRCAACGLPLLLLPGAHPLEQCGAMGDARCRVCSCAYELVRCPSPDCGLVTPAALYLGEKPSDNCGKCGQELFA